MVYAQHALAYTWSRALHISAQKGAQKHAQAWYLGVCWGQAQAKKKGSTRAHWLFRLGGKNGFD